MKSSDEVVSHEARLIIIEFADHVERIYTNRDTRNVMDDPVTPILLSVISVIAHFAKFGDSVHLRNLNRLMIAYLRLMDEGKDNE